MSGFQSRARDAVHQAAPTFAAPTIANRGLSQFVDPSTTGLTRFMQKSGYPYALFTPQMTAQVTETAAAGASVVRIQGARLESWLMAGLGVAFELLEDHIIESYDVLADGIIDVTLATNLVATHLIGTSFTIRTFPINAATSLAGDGAAGSAAVSVTSPFLLVPGDELTISGAKYVLSSASLVSHVSGTFTYEIKTSKDGGFPALTGSSAISVKARAAYQSEILTLPQAMSGSMVRGPVAIDWVSGPMVADYFPTPESELYLEEFDASNRQVVAARQVQKNDTLIRTPIERDQMLFWRVAEGTVNWNGTFIEMKAQESGRVHLWTPCRPGLDSSPPITASTTVPSFAPYKVLLLNRIVEDSVSVVNRTTKAEISSSDYTVDASAGTVSFISAHASQPIDVTYRPLMEWQLPVFADVDDVEIVVVVGGEDKQMFSLPTANVTQTLTIKAETEFDINQLHITARRTDGSAGAFTVHLGDWQPRGGITAAIRYTLTTGAEVDYDWASSGLLVKALWPTLELLRARLDGESILSRYLDNGRMLL